MKSVDGPMSRYGYFYYFCMGNKNRLNAGFPEPMEEPFEPNFDSETLSLVKRFEKTLQQGQRLFFDIDEFEEIIEYYFFKNDQRKALLTIRQALEQHPGCIQLQLKLAQSHINSNKEKDALRILKETDHITTGESDIHLSRGNLYSQLEEPEKAISAYKQAVNGAEFPDDLYSNIAFEYENLGNYDKAIDYLLKALAVNPENDPALYEFSFCCEVSQQTGRSISFLLDFIDQYPYSIAAWFNLGIAYSNQELYEKAIEAYDFVLAIDETFSSAYFNKANCYANIGNYDKAIETYFETFFHEEPEPVTYYYIAECYEKQKKFNLAIEHYQKSIGLDPDFADAWLGMGICNDELGKPQTAIPYIQKALKLAPSVPEYWFILGDILIRLQRIDEGIAAYRKVTELDPEDTDIWLELSVVYADQKDYENAAKVLQEGLHHHELQPDLYYYLAYCLFLSGKTREAEENLHRALQLNFEGHKQLFTTFPEAALFPAIVDGIEAFKVNLTDNPQTT